MVLGEGVVIVGWFGKMLDTTGAFHTQRWLFVDSRKGFMIVPLGYEHHAKQSLQPNSMHCLIKSSLESFATVLLDGSNAFNQAHSMLCSHCFHLGVVTVGGPADFAYFDSEFTIVPKRVSNQNT